MNAYTEPAAEQIRASQFESELRKSLAKHLPEELFKPVVVDAIAKAVAADLSEPLIDAVFDPLEEMTVSLLDLTIDAVRRHTPAEVIKILQDIKEEAHKEFGPEGRRL